MDIDTLRPDHLGCYGYHRNTSPNSLIYQADMATTILEGIGSRMPSLWDGESFFKEIERGEQFCREDLVISQKVWSCHRIVRFKNWTLIRTYHIGLKNFQNLCFLIVTVIST